MYYVIRFRLYPTEEQLILFYKTSGCCRWLYNKCKAHKDNVYKRTGENLDKSWFITKIPKLKQKYLWLKEVPSQSLQQAIIDLNKAYQNFFNGRAGYPKYKKYSDKRSFRLPQRVEVNITEKKLRLGKLGWCTARGAFNLYQCEKIQNVNVSQDSDGKWYASVLIKKDTTNPYHCHTYSSCGIDLGVNSPLTVVYKNNSGIEKHKFIGKTFSKELAKKEKKRKKYQKQYARKQKGSKNQEKARKKVAKAFYKEKEYRRNFIEQTSFKLASLFKTVVFEDLRLKNMTKSAKGTQECPGTNVKAKAGLNREMLRLGHGNLVLRTVQKSKKFQGQVLFVDPRRTSQECRMCGHVDKDNRHRSVFLCQRCEHAEHADINAGHNIRRRGLKLVA